jgi:hypothetical protein
VIAAIEEFGIECSIIKVLGSEVLDFVVDEAVQIYGGYGYVSDYPAERYYRDSRINRIYEGTNEINRMLIPGMLMKRALKGELPLLAAAKQVQDALLAIPDFGNGNGNAPLFASETQTAEQMKKAVLLVAGVAAQRFGKDLQNEQEVLGWTADMVMQTYALESAVLRARKITGGNGAGERASLLQEIVSLIAYEAAEVAGRAGREALAHMSHGASAATDRTGGRGRARLSDLGLTLGAHEAQRVRAHVVGPRSELLLEARQVPRVERAHGFFKARQIAAHCRQEAVRPVLRAADLLAGVPLLARHFHQLAQRDRSAAGLRIEPVPVTRQQGDLARDDAQPRSASPGRSVFRLLRCGDLPLRARRDFLWRAAQIQVDGSAGLILEDRDGVRFAGVEPAAHHARDDGELARGDSRMACKSGVGRCWVAHRRSPSSRETAGP